MGHKSSGSLSFFGKSRLRRNTKQLRTERLEPRIVLDSTVVFNEIMYNPMGGDDDKMEFVELHNQLAVDMDISEWKLTGGVEFDFPDGTIVPGRSQLVIAADPAALQEATGITGVLGPWTGRLNNGGETLQLFNNDERLMNQVSFSDGGDWPEAPDGGGVSLSKLNQQTASHLTESWSFSGEIGGTPGANNRIPEGTFDQHAILGESAPATAFVPTDASLGLTWIQPDFDDSAWLQGTTGIGFDSGRNEPYNEFLGLDLDAPPNGQDPMPMEDVNGSVYIRIPFELNDDPTRFDRLQMLLRYEDGFVAHLNGTEWVSDLAPGRNGEEGELAWDSTASGARPDTDAVVPRSFDLLSRVDLLRPGQNILAIQAMNRRISDSDLLVSPTIIGFTKVVPDVEPSPLNFSEIAAAGDDFFVEIINDSLDPQELEGLTLSTPGGESDYVFSAGQLGPGERVSVDAATLNFNPADGEQIQLFAPNKALVIDARAVSDRLQGLEESTGIWQYPSSPTPGSANASNVTGDIVINEIMYSAPLTPGVLETAPTYERTELFPIDWASWRYNQSGTDLGVDWFNQSYAVDNVTWFEGAAPLGASNSETNPPIQTELVVPRDNDPRFVTHYFQTEFDIDAAILARADIIELSYLIDDGAVVYINGQEVRRDGVPEGEVTFETSASAAITLPTMKGPFPLASGILKTGTNTISVDLKQDRGSSRDIVMAMKLGIGEEVTELIPGTIAQENDEEWIELYNRGNETVDLTGWRFRDGMRFDFEDGTTIGAGEYLVVSNNREALQAKFADINIVGDFAGTLSNRDDRLRLYDAGGNLADDVHYYEAGRFPTKADGGGVTLELTNPSADNSKGEVWSVSDNSAESEWVSHTRRGFSDVDVTGSTAAFHEFVFGMLSAAEILLDDISVIQDPAGEAIQVLQNGTFEADALGTSPEKWRLIGNHSGQVIVDPTNPANKVLHMTATGAQANIHDHVETTFADAREIIPGMEYEISFKAKWLNGNSQLNTRLFYNRLPDTLNLHVPEKLGTPGAQNSSFVENVGPTFSNFSRDVATPNVGQAINISVRASDPDGVTDAKLWWRPEAGEWAEVAMATDALGTYQAQIPGHESGEIVQYYVESTDGQGVSATFPAAGPDSRALVQVADGKGPLTSIDTFRIILTEADRTQLYSRINRMSNRLVNFTLVHNENVFHNIQLRQVGSRWIRPNSGYKIRFDPANPFYGVHDSVRFDLNGMAEIMMKQMINRAGGGKTSAYDDIGYLVVNEHPGVNDHNHEILLNLARFENVYLNEQFQDGSSGTKWELDDVVYPSSPVDRDPEGLKQDTVVIETADIGVSTDVALLQGSDPEFYRAHLLIKSNRNDDRFDVIKNFAHAIHQSGDALFEATNEVMDVDLWMRHYANQAYLGNWDTYGFRRPKNLRIYQRPEDGKIIPFFWDCDLCNYSERLFNPTEPTSRLDEIREIPHNLRLYWGHMLDYVNSSFNAEYVERWAAHYGELTGFKTHGGDENFVGIVESTRRRSAQALEAISEAIPPVEFQITTPNGQVVNPDENTFTIEGKGWVNVRKIRLAGSGIELDAFWPEADSWQVDLPLLPGQNEIALEAVDFDGDLISTQTVTVVSEAQNPIVGALRVTELNYNPGAPTQAEADAGYGNDDFEFIELMNNSDAAISLVGVELARVDIDGESRGVGFDFTDSAVTMLEPGQSVIVVEDLEAFSFRYGDGIANVAGQWSGGLSNSSETVTLSASGSLVQQFTYQDEWHPLSDGDGSSLVVVNVNAELAMWNEAGGWSPSGIDGGSPGQNIGRPGDANGDGRFTTEDLILISQSGEFEDGIEDNSTFAEGDWNGDGDFTTADLVLAFVIDGYEGGAPGAIPAPSLTEVAAVDRARDLPNASPENSASNNSAANERRSRGAFVERTVRRTMLNQRHVEAVFESDNPTMGRDSGEATSEHWNADVDWV